MQSNEKILTNVKGLEDFTIRLVCTGDEQKEKEFTKTCAEMIVKNILEKEGETNE